MANATLNQTTLSETVLITGKNNGFLFLDIFGYLKNTHKNPKFGRVRQVPIWELRLGLVSLCQIWDFYGYSLNTQKYPKMEIRYFFLCICPHLPIEVQTLPYMANTTAQVITLLTCIGNGISYPVENLLVFAVILKTRSLWTVFNTSVLCLAFTDLLIAMFVSQRSLLIRQESI